MLAWGKHDDDDGDDDGDVLVLIVSFSNIRCARAAAYIEDHQEWGQIFLGILSRKSQKSYIPPDNKTKTPFGHLSRIFLHNSPLLGDEKNSDPTKILTHGQVRIVIAEGGREREREASLNKRRSFSFSPYHAFHSASSSRNAFFLLQA